MILLLDNYDSFTYNLADYLQQIGVQVTVLQNDTNLEKVKAQDWKGIIISPGPETPEKAGITMEVVKYYYDKIPMLGICLGFQAIGQFFGAQLQKCPVPVHGKISRVSLLASPLYTGLPSQINVTRYHSLGLSLFPESLTITGISETDNTIMSFDHKTLPVCGVQYHPEAWLTEYGLDILRNWVTFNKLV